MKKTLLAMAIVGAMGATATTASASVLSVDAGSNFEMEVAPGFFLATQITGLNGINTDAALAHRMVLKAQILTTPGCSSVIRVCMAHRAHRQS